ncbi:MAG TPA: hypothetical protein VI818_02310 [Candidatus Thermoplasmatota archaeon]|nr:hypothetical protein [Candidatus Thermoplasmatota archaeon]
MADEDVDEDQPQGAYAVVHSLPDKPVLACTVFSEEEKPLAHRQWVLEPDGIHIYCACSHDGRPLKVRANSDGTTEISEPFHDDCSETIAPEPIDSIHEQMTKEIEGFADEWDTRPIKYYFMEGKKEVATRRLRLTGLWNDEDALDYSAATWYIIEGERLLDEIEETVGDLEQVRKRWDGSVKPSMAARRIPEFEEKP